MENISVTQGTGSWGNTLLLQEPCACQGQSVGETALRTVVAGFCPPSCTARVRVPAAGLVGWIALGNAPDQGKFGLFTFCYNEEPFWGMTSSPLCYSLRRAAPGQMLMDHFTQTWAFRAMFYCLPHWFLDAFNLYMSILWLNAWVVRRQHLKPVAPVPFHVTDQTCLLVNNILCSKKSVSFVLFKMFIMVHQSTPRSRAPKLSHRPESCANYLL